MLFRRTIRWVDSPLCYECGVSLFRSLTNRTLYTGWWGFISFFANPIFVAGNLHARWRLREVRGEIRRDPNVVTPLPRPMALGRPLHRRSGPYFAAALVSAVLVLGATQNGSGSPGGSPQQLVGQCVTSPDGSTVSGFVSCSQPHFAMVVAAVSSAAGCPANSNETLTSQDGTSVLCINTYQ